MFIRHCTMIPLVTEKRSDYVDANTVPCRLLKWIMFIGRFTMMTLVTANRDWIMLIRRCTMQVTVKRNMIMLMRRVPCRSL